MPPAAGTAASLPAAMTGAMKASLPTAETANARQRRSCALRVASAFGLCALISLSEEKSFLFLFLYYYHYIYTYTYLYI